MSRTGAGLVSRNRHISAADVLYEARKHVAAGWTQGVADTADLASALHDETHTSFREAQNLSADPRNRQHCLVGAIFRYFEDNGRDEITRYNDATGLLYEQLPAEFKRGPGSKADAVGRFNNAPSRTHQEVIDLMDRAIATRPSGFVTDP